MGGERHPQGEMADRDHDGLKSWQDWLFGGDVAVPILTTHWADRQERGNFFSEISQSTQNERFYTS